MDRGAWQAKVHRVAKSWTQLNTQKIHHLKFIISTIFKCSTVALSAFMLLGNSHHHPFPELFHLPKLKLCSV